MDEGRVKQRDTILKNLKADNVGTIVVAGDAGMGKTWLAREVSKHAEKDGLCYVSLWLYLNRRYGEMSLYEDIARQLSILSPPLGWEDNGTAKAKLDSLKKEIREELSKRKGSKKQFLLLILDDEGSMTDREKVMTEWGLSAFLKGENENHLNVLITTRKKEESSISGEDGTLTLAWTLKPLIEKESLDVLTESVCKEVLRSQQFDRSAIIKRSMGLPAAVIVIAKALNYIAQMDAKFQTSTMTRALQEAADSSNTSFSDEATTSEITADSQRVTNKINPLLQLAFEMLTNEATACCFWHVLDFYQKCGSVHERDLIIHWILEGYCGPVNCIAKAYQYGHSILMELIERGLLKLQEDNTVVPEVAMMDLIDHRRGGLFGTSSLGLAKVFAGEEERGLGKIIQIDVKIKALSSKLRKETIKTALIDGTFTCKEVFQEFFHRMQKLEVLGIFNPMFNFLAQPLSELTNLRVLVIRDCHLLDNVGHIADLDNLHVLEISGARRLKQLPDNLFERRPPLEILNLSKLLVQHLPSSISQLSKLRHLILRECSKLEDLPNLEPLTNLEVLDVSGANALKTSTDKRKNKSLAHIQKLQMLDFSQSKLVRLPMYFEKSQSLGSLTRLLLRDCTGLTELPNLEPLSGLQILDLSGAVNIKVLSDELFVNKKELTLLDVSSTSIRDLPSSIGSLCKLQHLFLRSCCNIRALPELEGLTSLEVLDASGCQSLATIQQGSFKFMSRLKKLDLSSTDIQRLPDLPRHSNLRYISLKDCRYLENLPELEGLTRLEVLELPGCLKLETLPKLDGCQKLEVLDLSVCIELRTIDGALESMSHLQTLNLSETKIKRIPSLSNCGNLSRLLLRKCSCLQELPRVESLSKLQELDLSDLDQAEVLKSGIAVIAEALKHTTKLQSLHLSGVILPEPSFLSGLTNLSQLSLTMASDADVDECLSHLSSLNHLKVLTLSGITTAESLYKFMELRSLEHLVMQDFNIIDSEIEWNKMEGLAEEIHWGYASFSIRIGATGISQKPPLQITGAETFRNLTSKGRLWRKCSKEFRISVCLNDKGKCGESCSRRDVFGYEDIYFRTRGFTDTEKHPVCLEIHGPDTRGDFRRCIEAAEHVSFIDNLSASFSSILDACQTKAPRRVWLERCPKMEKIFSDENGADATSQVEHMERLWILNLPKLESICRRSLRSDTCKNLKRLTIDCCPKLKILFSTSQLPGNLEFLHVKFCDQLEKVFEKKCELPKLHTVILFNLPLLSAIGARLPVLEEYSPKKCPKLTDTKESLKTAYTSHNEPGQQPHDPVPSGSGFWQRWWPW